MQINNFAGEDITCNKYEDIAHYDDDEVDTSCRDVDQEAVKIRGKKLVFQGF